ncbi:MAG: VCBS repeat-containing protein [candidate division Zixibacteria bacterium]
MTAMRLILVSGLVIISMTAVVSAQSSTITIPEFKKSTQTFESIYSTGLFLAVISNYGQSLILLNDGTGNFIESQQVRTHHGIVGGDIDLDGDIDLITTPTDGENCHIYSNTGSGIFEKGDRDIGENEPGFPMFVRLVDLDYDGDLDAIIETGVGQYFDWINDGSGQFEKGESSIPKDAAFCDLNGDGAVDILIRESIMELTSQGGNIARTARSGEIGFRVYLNDMKGNFESYAFLPESELVRGQYIWTWFADIENDGDMDVIYTDLGAHPVGILNNDGTGRLTKGQELASVGSGKIGVGDLNNDGHIDLVITNVNNPAQVWMNDGKGTFFDSGIRLDEQFESHGCDIKDLDNDGDLDIFITFYRNGSAGIWFNQLTDN